MNKLTGAEIKGLRLALGETQTVFAERFGVAYITVGKWEKEMFHPLPCFEKMLQTIKAGLEQPEG